MNTQRLRGAAAATAVALALTATSAIGVSSASGIEPGESLVDTVDYLADTYGLEADNVFETVTFERFEWLLKSEGTFAFLIGGPDSTTTNATISLIDGVAKDYGVDTVYTFNPKLDGGSFDVRDASGLDIAQGSRDQVQALYTRILAEYLNKDTTPAFTKASTDPYLFVYDKSHTIDGVEDRIVSSLDVQRSAAELAETGAAEAYEAQVADVFEAVTPEGSNVAELDTRSQFDFYETEVNRRHLASYPTANFGGEILADSDNDDDWRIQSVTYPELLDILESEGDYVILFGGTWCHNTRAVIKAVNEYAQENNIAKVYNFDLSLDSTGNGGTNALHIRDNAVRSGATFRAANLYGDLVNTYLSNIKTEYGKTIGYYPNGDTTKALETVEKLQVPFVIQYNKDAKDAEGNAAPVARQWIQETDTTTTGYKEYMTEWWWVRGDVDGPYTPGTVGWDNNVPKQRAFAAEGIAKLDTFFSELPVYVDNAHTVETTTTVSSVVAGTTATLTATIAADGVTAVDAAGSVEFFAGSTSLGSAAVAAGIATKAVTTLAGGTHTVHAVYTPTADSVLKTSTASAVDVVIPVTGPLTIAPVVEGSLAVGRTLSVELNANYSTATATKYQWLREGKAISKATKSTYVLTAADRTKRISATVVVTQTGVAKKAVATTPKTAKIGSGTITIGEGSELPTITGTTKVGSILAAANPSYSTSGLAVARQWLRNGAAISKATKATYTVAAADLGAELSVRVTVSKPGYTSLSLTSAVTGDIAKGELAASGTPKITGTVKVGKTLTVSGVKFNATGASVRYAWYADDELVQLSGAKTLVLTWQERGASITVKAIGAKSGYVSAESVSSNETVVVK